MFCAINLLPNFLNIWCDIDVDNIMFRKDLLKDWSAPIFSSVVGTSIIRKIAPQPRDSLKGRYRAFFMKVLASSLGTHVEGALLGNVS
jgi:hypothetical protein